MNPDSPRDAQRLAALLQVKGRRVPHAAARKIQELADGGLTLGEIATRTGTALHLVTLVLRSGAGR